MKPRITFVRAPESPGRRHIRVEVPEGHTGEIWIDLDDVLHEFVTSPSHRERDLAFLRRLRSKINERLK